MQQSQLSKNTNLITIYGALLILPIIFFPTTMGMISVWYSNETFTHGFLVFPIVFWLIWQKKNLINQAYVETEKRLLILIIPLVFLWYVSFIVDVQIAQQFAFIMLIQTVLWFFLGREVIKLIIFPLGFLVFAIPFGQSFIPPLMEFTANFTVFMVKLTGIPIYQEGLLFSLPSGNWSVVEECSGVRYLIASVVLGTLFAYTSYSSRKKIIIFILISILVPILANSLRAFGIVMIGHFSGMTLATGVDHLVYGWVFFGIVIFLLFFFGSYWADPLETFKLPPAKPFHKSNNLQRKNVLYQVTLYVFLVFCVYGLTPNKATHITDKTIAMPNHFGSWQHEEDRALRWQPIITNADTFITKAYIFDKDLVQLNVGYFQHQRNGAEAISTMNHIASPLNGKWRKMTGTDIKHEKSYITETEIKYQNTKILVWHWYQLGTFETPNPYIAKLFDAYNLIVNNRNDAAMITIATVIHSDKETSRKILGDFLNNSSSTINNLIKQK